VREELMPHLDYVRYEDAPEEVREALEESAYAESEERHLFYEMLSNCPSVVGARADYFRELVKGGSLPAREKELAYLTVALVTDTEFVAATHGRYLVEDHGVAEGTVRSLAAGDLSVLDERDRAIVTFARDVVRESDGITVESFDALRAVGFDDETRMELLLLTCEAQTATTIVTATGMALADRGETAPEYLPSSFDL
jgi:alkylhydroperoxidase family enzyme